MTPRRRTTTCRPFEWFPRTKSAQCISQQRCCMSASAGEFARASMASRSAWMSSTAWSQLSVRISLASLPHMADKALSGSVLPRRGAKAQVAPCWRGSGARRRERMGRRGGPARELPEVDEQLGGLLVVAAVVDELGVPGWGWGWGWGWGHKVVQQTTERGGPLQHVDVVRRDPVLLLEVGDVEEPLLLQLQHAPLLGVRVRVRARLRAFPLCHHNALPLSY